MPDEIKDPDAADQEVAEKKKSSFGNIPKKQIYLLIAVLVIAVFLAIGMLVIKPLVEKAQDQTEQKAELESQIDDLQMQAQQYNARSRENQDAKSKYVSETSKLFPLMDAATVDKTITPKIKSLGIDIQSLQITGLTTFFTDSQGNLLTSDSNDNGTMTYNQVLEYGAEDATEATTQAITEAASSSGGGVTYGEASEAIAGESDATAATQEINSGEYYYSMNYSLVGDYSQIVNLLDNISKDVAMQIESIDFQTGSDNGGSAVAAATDASGNQITEPSTSPLNGKYTINIVINVYMYDNPEEGVAGVEETTDSTELVEGSEAVVTDAAADNTVAQ